MDVEFKIGSKPEKTVIAATAAVVLSIIFDQHKKKMRGSKKYKNFPKRVVSYYKLVDSLLRKTAAKALYDDKEHFVDEQLEKLTIENAEVIDI